MGLDNCPSCGKPGRVRTLSNQTSGFGFGCRFRIECHECPHVATKNYEIIMELKSDGSVAFVKDERNVAMDTWNRRSK